MPITDPPGGAFFPITPIASTPIGQKKKVVTHHTFLVDDNTPEANYELHVVNPGDPQEGSTKAPINATPGFYPISDVVAMGATASVRGGYDDGDTAATEVLHIVNPALAENGTTEVFVSSYRLQKKTKGCKKGRSRLCADLTNVAGYAVLSASVDQADSSELLIVDPLEPGDDKRQVDINPTGGGIQSSIHH